MNPEMILPYVARWIHIASAIAAVGGAFFIRFALMPAASRVLADDVHQKLREQINARWRVIVYILITLFILTGFYNFMVPTRVDGVLVTARWKDYSPEDKRVYHMLFGIKVLAAFGMFFLASVLPGRTATFAPIRNNARMWLVIFLVLAAVVISCSTALRFLPRTPAVSVQLPG